MKGRPLRIAHVGIEEAKMIVESLRPITFVPDQPGIDANLVEDQLVTGAVALRFLYFQNLRDDSTHGIEVLTICAMRRRKCSSSMIAHGSCQLPTSEQCEAISSLPAECQNLRRCSDRVHRPAIDDFRRVILRSLRR